MLVPTIPPYSSSNKLLELLAKPGSLAFSFPSQAIASRAVVGCSVT